MKSTFWQLDLEHLQEIDTVFSENCCDVSVGEFQLSFLINLVLSKMHESERLRYQFLNKNKKTQNLITLP